MFGSHLERVLILGMEMWSVSHRNLQIFCADFWPSADDCQLILDEIGVNSIRINLSEPAIMRWLSIIRELMRKNDGSMSRLVLALMKQYPDNKQLAAVSAPWIPAAPVKAMTGDVVAMPPPPTPELVALVAPAEDAEEAQLIVPRLDTLWEAMVDQERRLDELERLRDSLFAQQPSPKPEKKKDG